MKYVCIAIVSLLILCTSAMNIDEPRDLHACNVSETRIMGQYVSMRPESNEFEEGSEYFEDVTSRYIREGIYIRYSGDTEIKLDFIQLYFFRPYTMTVSNITIKIPGRTHYFYSKDAQNVEQCHKLSMSSDYVYQKPGVSDGYSCRYNFVEGWEDLQAHDGVLVNYCTRSVSTDHGTVDVYKTVTSEHCYPIRRSEIKKSTSSFNRIEIIDERRYFNWHDPVALPDLPAPCMSI